MKFQHFEPTVEVVIKYLDLLSIDVTKSSVDETLQNHPDWPTMLAISDSFKSWNIPNAALKISNEEFDSLEPPFLAYLKNSPSAVAIVTAMTTNSVTFLIDDFTKNQIASKADFLLKCTGYYLVAEKAENSGEKDFEKKKLQDSFKSLLPIAFILLVVILSFVGIFFQHQHTDQSFTGEIVFTAFQLPLSIIGIVLSLFLVSFEINASNPLLKKVCTSISKGNCSAILSSKQSKLFNWLSWSEIGLFYFFGSFLTLILGGYSLEFNNLLVSWLSILGLPYTFFSIYYQWKVVKQWCVLCLAVQFVLILGFINVFFYETWKVESQLSFEYAWITILLYLLPVIGWYSIKPLMLELQKAKNTKRAFLRLKFNKELFITLLKSQEQVSLPVEGLGIDFGNPSGTHTLIKVCNPYCGPCSKAHQKIEHLLEKNNNIKVKLIFKTPIDANSASYQATAYLMAVAKAYPSIIQKVLDDWYLSDPKDLKAYKLKYPISDSIEDLDASIMTMQQWCDVMQIYGTPTMFLNGYKLPDTYAVEDISYFLAD
jgi:uncharacterized membrane protein/thiol-disulfide isomerase/thioredoxin